MESTKNISLIKSNINYMYVYILILYFFFNISNNIYQVVVCLYALLVYGLAIYNQIVNNSNEKMFQLRNKKLIDWRTTGKSEVK